MKLTWDQIELAGLVPIQADSRYTGDFRKVEMPYYGKMPTKEELLSRITHLGIEVETGGASGGSCWGDEAEYYSTGDYPDKDDLVRELSKVGLFSLKEASLEDYFNLKDKFVSFSRNETEYYGNYRTYGVIAVRVKNDPETGFSICE